MALLHATRAACAPLGVRVVALHVHHGLLPQADSWLDAVQRQCTRWRIGFAALRLADRPAPGDSVEAWARRERYRALRRLALEQGASIVLLAHHRRDQAETFLLQALRGAGAAGLAAMPRAVRREGINWVRPWLDQPREVIDAYARQHRLRFADDPSNADPRFARSRLRVATWPALVQAFPDAEGALAAAADEAAAGAALQREVADDDLARCVVDEALVRSEWLQLTPARRTNALRAWLQRHGMVPGSLIRRLIDEWPRSPRGSWPMPGGQLRAHRDTLRFVADAPPTPSQPQRLEIHRVGRHRVEAWRGHLVVARTTQAGVAWTRVATIELRPRCGAERFQAGLGRPPRSLKKQFQAADVPAWLRDGPLVYDAAGRLLYAAGLGIDARAVAAPGEPQVTVEWVADPRR